MRPILHGLARVISTLCAIFFVVSLCVSLFLVNTEKQLFNAEFYKTVLKSQDVYARLPSILAEQINSNLNPSAEKSNYLQYLTIQDWDGLIKALVPLDQIQVTSEGAIDSLVDFSNGKNNNPVISLVFIKKTLGTQSNQAVTRILTARPACTNEQLAQIFTSILANEPVEDDRLCNPPADLMLMALPLISQLFESQISALPDTLPIFETPPIEKRDALSRYRTAARVSPFLPIGLLALLTLLSVRSLSNWLKWWGFPLSLGGLVTIGMAFLVEPVSRLAITNVIARNNSPLTLRLASIGMDIMQALIHGITFPIAIQASIFLLVGLGMLTAAWLSKKIRPS